MKIVCDYCGKTFKRKTCSSEYNRYKHHFCNRECSGRWKRMNKKSHHNDTESYRSVLHLRDMYNDKKALEKMFV